MAKRVAKAAEAALRKNGYATAIDVMLGIGWLQSSHLLAWQTRRLPCLENGIQANLNKIAEAKRARVQAQMQKPPELVAVVARHPDWRCHRCAGTGALLVMEPEGPACLQCAGLGHLEELPAGDTLLTRRARAASKLSAVIVKWSPARKRNERIGVLVEPEALARARASIEAESGP